MPDHKERQAVFTELYERFEAGLTVSVELQEEAHKHGIVIEAVERAALASMEDDLEDE